MIILILLFALPLIFIYCKGKLPHLYKNNDTKINIINIQLPSSKCINNLEVALRNNGTILNPQLNFNNAQGKKLNYNQLPNDIQEFYENKHIQNVVSHAVGEQVYYANKNEKYKIFSRLYENENDFIEWHRDNNFTKGTRYTLVIPILVDLCNTSEFMVKDNNTNKIKTIPIKLGQGVVYDGSVTYHKISRQTKGNGRIVIIIPFYSNPKKTIFGNILEKIRNVTYNTLTL
jgi:hypothetical protein